MATFGTLLRVARQKGGGRAGKVALTYLDRPVIRS